MERTQGAVLLADARCRSPASVRFSRYFISPAWPASTHWTKASNSGRSSLRTGAMPARSKPASMAASLAACASCSCEITPDHYLAASLGVERKALDAQLFDFLVV